MVFMLGCEKVAVEFPTKTVFESVSLGVDEGDRIGIVGRNGDGKSTLLSVLAGVLPPDEGRVLRNGAVRVGVLGQSDNLNDEDTVERAVVGDIPAYEWAGDARIRDIIAGLASDIPWDAQVGTLSGGQRRRVDLVRLLIGDWDILALDEPTNHLDVRAITWLANHLKTRWRAGQGALLVVTHDRWFLDEVCTRMWEVHDRMVEPFEGGPGDRYGIVGANGVGKTTLLKVIQGKTKPQTGFVKIGKTVKFAVLSQHLDNLTRFGNDRVRQVISNYTRRMMLDGKEMTPAQLLEKLGFSRADLNEPVCDLSGGQKRRLALMLILLDEPNVLILDEPGNDMDTDMLAAIEELLDAWPGTLLLVTHDRFLMERVTDHQFALIDGHVRHLPRGVDEYLEMTAHAAAPAGRAKAPQGSAAASAESAAESKSTSAGPQLSGGEIRELKKRMRSCENKSNTLRGKIEQAQADMAAADPSDFEALGKFQQQINDFQAQIDALDEQWLEAAEALGE